MPYFEQEIDVSDFLYECGSREIKEIIDSLIDDGHLPESVRSVRMKSNSPAQTSAAESEFEDALHKLHGKWNNLTSEEEQTIINISKRF